MADVITRVKRDCGVLSCAHTQRQSLGRASRRAPVNRSGPFGPGGSEVMDTSQTFVVSATTDGLREAEGGLDEFSAAHGLTRNDTWPFHVAIDEILSNIVKYGRPAGEGEGRVEIRLELQTAEALEMVILDDAAPFNPLEAEAARHRPGRRRSVTSVASGSRSCGGSWTRSSTSAWTSARTG